MYFMASPRWRFFGVLIRSPYQTSSRAIMSSTISRESAPNHRQRGFLRHLFLVNTQLLHHISLIFSRILSTMSPPSTNSIWENFSRILVKLCCLFSAYITIPPSTRKTCPVMYPAAGQGKALLATSSGWPNFPLEFGAECVFYLFRQNFRHLRLNEAGDSIDSYSPLQLWPSSL